MKQITITVPDNCELKQDGNTYTVVEKEKEKKLTYDDIARKLFCKDNLVAFIDVNGIINDVVNLNFTDDDIIAPNSCTSKKQAEKLLAINKLMNVAKYLNGDWQPDWNRPDEKYFILSDNSVLTIQSVSSIQCLDIYFKSEELAEQAIEILGEETIKLALCTDY